MPMRSTLICILLALAGLVPLAAAEPSLTDDLVARLVKQAGSSLNPDGKKQSLRVTQKRMMKDDTVTGWVLQAEWTEAGEARKGVVFAVPVAELPKGVELVARADGWGITPFIPGRDGQDADSVVADLKRQRMEANEATAVADLRAIVSAEEYYRGAANDGYYDTPSCLVAPIKCLPGYDARGITFLSQDTTGEKSGYRRKFHAGAKVADPGPRASRSSMTAYALTAIPITAGETGVRGFCVDYSNVLCFTPDGKEPRVADGKCPVGKGCEPVAPVVQTSEAAPQAALKPAFDPALEALREAARRADRFSAENKPVMHKAPKFDEQTRLLIVRGMQEAREAEERRQASMSQACARHILIKVAAPPRAGQSEAEARSRAQEVLTSLKARHDFADLAREFSEDAGSASRGGDLGCFSRGVLAPEFEKAAFALKVGETSDLVRTGIGFHIIERVIKPD
jgi:parvulin-like peptidyl-prolyl isomerase